MQTIQMSPLGRIPNGARLLTDLNRLGLVRQPQGFVPGQVVIVTLPMGAETIWVKARQFQLLKYSPALIQLAGNNPAPVADLGRALAVGCEYVRLRRMSAGSLVMEEEEEVQM